MTTTFGLRSAIVAFLVVPDSTAGAALMTLIACSRARTRGADLPILHAARADAAGDLRGNHERGIVAEAMWIPSLSQHLLVTTLIKAQPLDPLLVALRPGVSCLRRSARFAAARLYRREALG